MKVRGSMSDETMILLSFLLFMCFFAGVGLASMRVKEDTTDDYLVAGRGMHPGLAALSAVSTWNSGYMFIGFIGFIYLQGYSAIWIAVVSTIGQLVAWIWLYKYIQKEGEERGIRSLTSLVSSTTGSPEAKVAAVLSVLFLSIYAAAQLTAGGVALETMLNWTPTRGILIGFVLVVAYCYAGGIRASIWTDAAQSSVMIVGSTILCLVAVKNSGGLSGLHEQLAAVDDSMVSLFPSGLRFGAALWIAAFFLGGLGVAGQPQVVSRVMTLKDDAARKQAMVWFFVWQTPFIVLMFIIGLACRVLLPELGPDGAETGLPFLAMKQLSPFLGGVILASIFAATMSTADSQVLACTAAITDDVRPEWSQDHKTTKKVTLAMAVLATVISLTGQQFPGFGDSVFSLVVLAVYGLGAIFVPMILVRMMGYEPDTTHSILMMMAGFFGVIGWLILGFGGEDGIFPSVPGVGAAFATHFLLCWLRDDSPTNAFGRYSVPGQQTVAIGLAVLLAVVAVTEVSYVNFAPDSNANGADSGKAYTMNYTIEEWEKTETLFIGNDQTAQFSFTYDEMFTASLGIQFVISYGETNEFITNACDDVTVEPDFSNTAGPHDEVDDSAKSTSTCDSSEQLMASIVTDNSLLEFGSIPGAYTANGTMNELENNAKRMNNIDRMMGSYEAGVTVATNSGNPTADSGEEVTITWRALLLVPGEITAV
ncbi:sodium/proline symporter [Candidatus Poseidoniales archaeon]|nr:sodium/proline symporter [Candidatus Poseidoniales archaeon]